MKNEYIMQLIWNGKCSHKYQKKISFGSTFSLIGKIWQTWQRIGNGDNTQIVIFKLRAFEFPEVSDCTIACFTDRNFVAKYSQQVLHFDHEVTYYLQSINDSGQSTQN